MTRIFMYATHPTLVDHESQQFHNMGFDVYSAAWATNTRSNWRQEDIILNQKHFYQGICNFLAEDTISTLSKISTEMYGTVTNPAISKALIDNFDILYVSQITPWLMNYAPQFLAAGKTVLFRTFGYALNAWGSPFNYKDLFKYDKFYIVPTHYKEVELGLLGNYKRIRLITATMCEELITKIPNGNSNYLLTVHSAPQEIDTKIKNYYKDIAELKIINRGLKFISEEEYNYLYNNCSLYLDLVESLLRYSVFEAILHDKPIVIVKNKDMFYFMKYSNFDCPLEYSHNGLGDAAAIKKLVSNQTNLDILFMYEKFWLDSVIKETKNNWQKLFEEVL